MHIIAIKHAELSNIVRRKTAASPTEPGNVQAKVQTVPERTWDDAPLTERPRQKRDSEQTREVLRMQYSENPFALVAQVAAHTDGRFDGRWRATGPRTLRRRSSSMNETGNEGLSMANEPKDNQRKHGSRALRDTGGAAREPHDPCIRAENEDDDGYDPYSDRRPEPEPLFERDPWG